MRPLFNNYRHLISMADQTPHVPDQIPDVFPVIERGLARDQLLHILVEIRLRGRASLAGRMPLAKGDDHMVGRGEEYFGGLVFLRPADLFGGYEEYEVVRISNVG